MINILKKHSTYSRLLMILVLIFVAIQVFRVHEKETNFIETKKFNSVKTTKIKSKPTWPITLNPSYGSYIQDIDLSKIPSEEREFMMKYMPVMLNRVKKVGDFCNSHPDPTFHRNGFSKHFIWIQQHNDPTIIWCCNFKVGSGTWTANFLRVAHFNEKNPKFLSLSPSKRDQERFSEKNGATYSTLKEIFPLPESDQTKIEVFRNSIRFLNVRHPFSRLLSGYRNIMEFGPSVGEVPIFRRLRKEIISKFRPISSMDKRSFPSFSEYVDFFIDTTKDFKTYSQWRNFSQNIIGAYWEPFWTNCNICSFDPGIIVKLETHKQDEKFLSILANLKEVKKRKHVEWRHMINGESSQDLAADYYKNLTRKQISTLYKIYKYDFQLFDYDIKSYLNYLDE